jgi:hypothetical protein
MAKKKSDRDAKGVPVDQSNSSTTSTTIHQNLTESDIPTPSTEVQATSSNESKKGLKVIGRIELPSEMTQNKSRRDIISQDGVEYITVTPARLKRQKTIKDATTIKVLLALPSYTHLQVSGYKTGYSWDEYLRRLIAQDMASNPIHSIKH